MTEKKDKDLSVKSAMDQLFHNYHLDEKMAKVKLINSWEETMGKMVAHRTTELIIRERKLFVSLNSASLRQELFQSRFKILETLNEAAGIKVIDEVIFR